MMRASGFDVTCFAAIFCKFISASVLERHVAGGALNTGCNRTGSTSSIDERHRQQKIRRPSKVGVLEADSTSGENGGKPPPSAGFNGNKRSLIPPIKTIANTSDNGMPDGTTIAMSSEHGHPRPPRRLPRIEMSPKHDGLHEKTTDEDMREDDDRRKKKKRQKETKPKKRKDEIIQHSELTRQQEIDDNYTIQTSKF